MNPYLQSFKRFWWLGLPALLAALAAATVVLYRVDVSLPPSEVPTFEKRAQPSYIASTQLIVNNTANPFVRIAQPSVVPAQKAPASENGKPSDPIITSQPTNLTTLVQAANVLPLFIESDDVARVRERMFGTLPGVVRAEALFSAQTPRGLRTSPVPAIQVAARAARPDQAVALAQGTVDAFVQWLEAKQNDAKVSPKERILIQQLQSPSVAQAGGASAYGLAALAFAAMLGAFAALAVLLNRLFPGKPSVVGVPVPGHISALSSTRADTVFPSRDLALTGTNGGAISESDGDIDNLVHHIQEILLDLYESQRPVTEEEVREAASDPNR